MKPLPTSRVPFSSLVLGLSLATSAPLAAQAVAFADLRADGNYGVFAIAGKSIDHEQLAKGAKVPRSLSLNASIRPFGGISTLVGWRYHKGGIYTVDISEQGAVSMPTGRGAFRGGSTSSAPSTTPVVQGPHSLRLHLSGKRGARGLLEVWSGGVIEKGVMVKYSVDAGDNGSIEFSSAAPHHGSQFIPVTFDKHGSIVVKLSSNVSVSQSAGGSLRYKTGMSLRFSPAPTCAVRSYGDSCGPRLSGRVIPSSTGNIFDLTVSGATANARGILIVGTRAVRLHLPHVKCPLLTNPVILIGYRTDAKGAKNWKFPIGKHAVDVRLQCADLGKDMIRPSNGLHVLCIK